MFSAQGLVSATCFQDMLKEHEWVIKSEHLSHCVKHKVKTKQKKKKSIVPSGKPGSVEVRSQVKNFTIGAGVVAQW